MFPRNTHMSNTGPSVNTNYNMASNQGSRRAFRDMTNASSIMDQAVKGKNGGLDKKASIRATAAAAFGVEHPQHPPHATNLSVNPAVPSRNGMHVVPAPPSSLNPAAESRGPVSGSHYQHTGPVDNIDERDANDPLCATDYVMEMYANYRAREVTTSIRPVYMENQAHINERMRSILVDWLVEVHLKFKLVPETLYLTVNLIDRFLERREVSRPRLQLVGVTCLLIASKYEEIYPPELRDLVYICDRAYSRNEIIDMEETVLKTLEYRITIPSAHAFLVRYLKAAHADKRIVQLSCYILDGTLQSYNLLHYLPSQLAASAVFIARKCAGRNPWSPTLLKYAQYCEEDIIPVARAVLAEKSSASEELKAVKKKYTSSRYGAVAQTEISCNF